MAIPAPHRARGPSRIQADVRLTEASERQAEPRLPDLLASFLRGRKFGLEAFEFGAFPGEVPLRVGEGGGALSDLFLDLPAMILLTGGFSLVMLTDQNHTWLSRFGRAR